jgi:hypothetical protein
MRRTRLSAEFGFEQWKEKHGAGTIPLFLITETGTLRLFTLSNPPLPVPGQTILALGQPEAAKPAPAT